MTAAMLISSAQFPMGNVYAEEIAASVQEDGNGDAIQESGEDSSGTDNSETGNSDENEGTEVENPSQSDDAVDEENPPAEDDASGEGGEDGIEESDAEELYVTGISDNDLVESEPSEIIMEGELTKAYQFGGAPSEKGDISVYSVFAQSDEVEEYLYLQMLNRNKSIDVSKYKISVDSWGDLVSGVLNEHPDLYFVQRNYRASSNGTYITSISLTYDDTLNDAAFKQSVKAALSCVNSQMSDLEKAVVLHDYLTVNCEYDYQNYLDGTIPSASYNAYGTLVNRAAVCQGYALTYKYLLSQVGINCYMVTSNAMNHAWNMIVLDGKYYQVDVTWDDRVWDRIGKAYHNYMFLSDDTFRDDDHEHHDWYVTYGGNMVDYQATDNRYKDAFWTDCDSPLVLAGNDCYYVSSKGSVYKTILSQITNQGTEVVSIGKWPVWSGGGNWVGSFSGLFQIGDRLYYNDKSSIYSIAMDGTGKRTEFTANTTTGYIYGSAYCQGKVLYALHKDPNETGKEKVLTADIKDISGESSIVVRSPNLTTYKVGQKIDLAGGAVFYFSGSQAKTVTLTANMIGGFDSTKPGICTVQVTYGGCTASFDTLILEEPELTASVGQSLGEIALPRNEYGFYLWQDDTEIIKKVGIYIFTAEFIPNDISKFQKRTDIEVQVTAQETLGTDTDVTFKTNKFTYNGMEQEPKVVVRASDTVLTEGQDYTLSYSKNKNAGTATVTIDGMGCYLGSISRTFEISPAKLVITAQDKAILIGDPIPLSNEYKYEVSGLMADDALVTEPTVSCGITSNTVAGQYDIVLSGADAGDNYIISYVNGRLTVASEYLTCTVTFDVQGHGTAPADQIDVKVGSTLNRPTDPMEEGYRFDGWYRDAACTKVWNFETDIAQSDMTLYAKWLGGSVGGGFAFQEIADVYYTGKACKPVVSVYDGDTLLKSGRDYQIKYFSNTNANKDGALKKGNGEGANFNPDLPYVEIIGKGNYTDRIKDGNKDTVKVNFNILRASIGDGTEKPAAGVTLKVSEQLVTAKKVQKPFTSIKYVKGMKKDTDFKVSLTVENARDQSGKSLQKGLELEGAAVPASFSGEFLLTVEGAGNYEGSICREIYVTDKAHLIKNATITIGKNLKNITFTGKPVQLKPAETNSADTFTVKYGKTFLIPGRDYTVSYRNHDRVGKAELIITGMGEYAGSKTATFNIKGKSFTAKAVLVEGIEDKVYTGRAITQNGVKLTYGTGNEELRYGKDYTISYSKNINKGTATMTFQSVAAAGYSGSFKKTFRITAADITQVNRSETMQNMVFNYCKTGVKPVNEILLTNQEGFPLRNGKDYTLKYANNRAVASASGDKPPTVTVKGKGNYAGEFSLNFEIIRTDLRADSIQIKTTPVAYIDNKKEDYVYKPAVKLTDGKSAMRAGTDYTIEYRNNTQADYESYIQKLQSQISTEDDMPVVVITEAEGSSYCLKEPIIVPLPIYTNKLTKANLSVSIGEAVYTGNQVKPEVTVSYGEKLLREGEDYTLSYGVNTASGKNKGSVVINGIAPNYGGSVTVKFEITKKPITY